MLCFCRTPAGPASYKPNLKTQVSQNARKSSPEFLVCFRPFYFGFLPSVPRGRRLVFCHTSFILAESEKISVFTKKKKEEALAYVPLEADANEGLSKTSCAYSYEM